MDQQQRAPRRPRRPRQRTRAHAEVGYDDLAWDDEDVHHERDHADDDDPGDGQHVDDADAAYHGAHNDRVHEQHHDDYDGDDDDIHDEHDRDADDDPVDDEHVDDGDDEHGDVPDADVRRQLPNA